MKKAIISVLKLAVTAGLIIWLVTSGKLSFASLRGTLEYPVWLAGGVFSVGLVVLASIVRWHFLITAQRVALPFSGTAKLSLIGLFFSTVIPGGVSGDLMKIYYIGERFPKSRSATFLSIFGDRIIGLSTLMMFALIALAFRLPLVQSSLQVKTIAMLIGLYFLGLIAFMPIVLSTRVRNHRWTNAVLAKLPLSAIITRLYDALHAFKRKPDHIVGAVVAGCFVALFSATAFFCFGNSLGVASLGLADYYLVIPLIFIVISVPISPAGIGVGQAAALFLFEWIGAPSESFGANLMTLYQIGVLGFALLGAVIFLTYKKEMRPDAPDHSAETVG